jgi:hypothetical protein
MTTPSSATPRAALWRASQRPCLRPLSQAPRSASCELAAAATRLAGADLHRIFWQWRHLILLIVIAMLQAVEMPPQVALCGGWRQPL